MKNNLKKLIICAIFIAMSTALSFVTIFHSPFGGSLTLASMLPIIIIGYLYGPKYSFGTAAVYSVVQVLISTKTVSELFVPGEVWKAFLILLLDYFVAYIALGIAGLIRKKDSPSLSLGIGSFAAITTRYLVHIISGAIFYGEWASWFFGKFGETGTEILESTSGFSLSLLYSVIYNGIYMIPEIIITTILGFIIGEFKIISKEAVFDK